MVALSGGLALVSDDLSLLDAGAHRRLAEVVALGRESDAAAIAGTTPRCDDLLRHRDACELTAVGRRLVVDPRPAGRRRAGPERPGSVRSVRRLASTMQAAH